MGAMGSMEDGTDENGFGGGSRAALVAVRVSLGTAVLFEALTVPATQHTPARAAAPWQDDPYHTMVFLAEFAVPVLALLIALRLLAWQAPGGPDRAQQTVRAAGLMTSLVGLTAASEWAALLGGQHRAAWNGWTWTLTGGLAAVCVLTTAAALSLARCRREHGSSRRWQHDWLGDAVLLAGRVPQLRRWATPEAAAWVRARAGTVFLAVSLLASAALTAAQAVGERWTDPLLIAWLLVALTASGLVICAVGNALAGFVARPPGSRARRVAEVSAVTGCAAVQVAIGFHDPLWSAFRSGPLTSVPALTALTLGPGLVASAATAAALVLSAPRPRPAG